MEVAETIIQQVKKTITIFPLIFLLVGCSEYQRKKDCDLDKLNVNGDVVMIETIVKSTVPLTEMFADIYNPSVCMDAMNGNYMIKFDLHGYAKQYVGYGIDGKELFNVRLIKRDNNLIPEIVGASFHEVPTLDSVIPQYDGIGRIVEATYLSQCTPIFISKMSYDSNGNIAQITKEYCTLTIPETECMHERKYADTTRFTYSEYDYNGNWQKASVSYRGLMKRHSFDYLIYRKLTYHGNPKQKPLLNLLEDVNTIDSIQLFSTHIVNMVNLGTVALPNYLHDDPAARTKLETTMPIHYVCYGVYNTSDSYATFTVSVQSREYAPHFESLTPFEMKYDKNADEELRNQMTTYLSKNGIYLFKWLPYQFTTICGQRALCLSYYRYGKGSPIPVYCENYELSTPNGLGLNISFSYQSNHRERFHNDFTTAINSISLTNNSIGLTSSKIDKYKNRKHVRNGEIQTQPLTYKDLRNMAVRMPMVQPFILPGDYCDSRYDKKAVYTTDLQDLSNF